MPADSLGLQSHLEVPSGGRETTWKPFSVPERFRDDPATDMKQTSQETGDSTALGCRALQHKTDRDWGLAVSPYCEMTPDSPALCPEQLRFPNQTRKEPRFA